MFKFIKKYKLDLIVIISLLVLSLSSFFLIKCSFSTQEGIAIINVSNKEIDRIDLKKENDIRILTYNGKYTEFKVEVKKNSLRIIENGCKNKTCINLGELSSSNPLICTYNEVYIELINASNDMDVEI